MARSAAPQAIEAIERQLRRVRRRWNLRELQRAAYLLVAAVAATAAALVVLALRASPATFTRSGIGVVAVTLGVSLAIVLATHRRWLRRAYAPTWIDRHVGLGGRLATLTEVAARGETAAALFPLLVEQNVTRLSLWHGKRLVPHRVPRAAFAAAASGLALLGLVVALAPRIAPPPPPAPAAAERPPPGVEPVAVSADQLALAAAERDDDATASDASRETELQRGIRRALGAEPARDAASGDGGAAESGAPSAPGEPGPDASEQDAARAAAEPTDDASRPGSLLEQPRDGEDDAGRGDRPASGAGREPDPNLFGPPTGAAPPASEHFALSLTTRMHARAGGIGGAGDTPSPRARGPGDLGPGQRAEAAVPRMPVPAAYEPLVRALFARERSP